MVRAAILFIYLTLSIYIPSVFTKPISQYASAPTQSDVGFAFTGAGGRIGQLNALAQVLINGTYPGANGVSIVPSHLAGVSSGALTCVALNAILETRQQNIANGFNFGDINYIFATTTDDDIYSFSKLRLIKYIDDGYVLNSDPFSDYLEQILPRLNGYSKLGDLYLPTYITVVDQRSGVNLRLLSTDPRYSNLPLRDVLLATTAIPVAFPPRPIPALSNLTQFIDGGTGIDYVPVLPLLSFPSVKTIYVITYNNAFGTGVSDDRLDAERGTIVKYALRAYNIQGANIAIGALAILSNANVTGYVYQPIFDQTFSTTDFNSLQQQYNLAVQWATSNAPSNVDTNGLLAINQTLPNYSGADGSDSDILGTGSANKLAVSAGLVFVLLATLL